MTGSSPYAWLTLLGCAGLLAVALLAAWPGARSPLSLPLTLLCINLFTWNLAAMAFQASGNVAWRYLDITSSPLTMPLTLHFVAVLVGRRRELGRVLALSYAGFGSLGLCALLAFFSPALSAFVSSRAWALAYLAGVLAVISYAVRLLIKHLRTTADLEEVRRTRLVFAAVAIGALLGSTELLDDLGVNVPAGGGLGAFAAAVVLFAAVRVRLLEGRPSARAALYALFVGAIAVVAYLALFGALSTHTALVALGTVGITLAVVASVRRFTLAAAIQKQRMERLAVLGRFSAQMAHDLKNPLAALKGAVQYLKEELARGRPFAEQAEYLELMAQQIERVREVLERYQRLGRVEVEAAPLDLNELVRSVTSSQRLAADPAVAIELELGAGLPRVEADRDLLALALENLLRNAFDAMPRGGKVVVRTAANGALPGGNALVVSIEDNGSGMDPRVAERAFDDFYTTKAQGSGLGLAFVRRVAEAHGGAVWLDSQLGAGTCVRLGLPLAAARSIES